jgi:hypothetical protein
MDKIISFQNTRDVKVVRVVWGSFNISNIPTTPQYNEIVYVWGTENRNNLKSLGYETILMSKDSLDYKFTHPTYQFIHKLIGIETSMKDYPKILFLDWDCNLVKELDDNFFNQIIDKKILAPIYSYEKSDYEVIYDRANDWYELQSNLLNKFSWEYAGKFVIPNAGFIYISDGDIATKLLNLAKDINITTLIEEFSLYCFTNTTLELYIDEYHPKCLYGNSTNVTLNEYVDSKLDMDIYFEHN